MACAAAAACSADWRDTSLPPQKRAELLTAEMTLDEKIGQLTSPYGWEMYERHGDSVRLTDAFREAVQNGHIGMLWIRPCTEAAGSRITERMPVKPSPRPDTPERLMKLLSNLRC